MKKRNLIKVLVSSTSLTAAAATVASCGINTTHNNNNIASSPQDAISKKLSTLKAFDKVSLKITDIKKGDPTSAIVKGNLSYDDEFIKKYLSINQINAKQSIKFVIPMVRDQISGWIVKDINGLLNPKDDQGSSKLARELVYNDGDTGIEKFNHNDKDLKIVDGPGRVIKNSINSSINAKNILTVSYKGHAITKSFNSKVADAYTYTWTKTYDLNKKTSTKATITNIVATHDEVIKQFIAKTKIHFNENQLRILDQGNNTWLVSNQVDAALNGTIIKFNNKVDIKDAWTIDETTELKVAKKTLKKVIEEDDSIKVNFAELTPIKTKYKEELSKWIITWAAHKPNRFILPYLVHYIDGGWVLTNR